MVLFFGGLFISRYIVIVCSAPFCLQFDLLHGVWFVFPLQLSEQFCVEEGLWPMLLFLLSCHTDCFLRTSEVLKYPFLKVKQMMAFLVFSCFFLLFSSCFFISLTLQPPNAGPVSSDRRLLWQVPLLRNQDLQQGHWWNRGLTGEKKPLQKRDDKRSWKPRRESCLRFSFGWVMVDVMFSCSRLTLWPFIISNNCVCFPRDRLFWDTPIPMDTSISSILFHSRLKVFIQPWCHWAWLLLKQVIKFLAYSLNFIDMHDIVLWPFCLFRILTVDWTWWNCHSFLGALLWSELWLAALLLVAKA